MKESGALSRKPVILGPGEGRSYPMGRIAAIFKADETESESLLYLGMVAGATHARAWRSLAP